MSRTIRMFEQLANKGFGGFIRLKSWEANENGDHKRPVSADWTNPENWFKTFEEASQGQKYGVGFALKDLIVLDVDDPVEGFDPEAYGTPYGITPSGGYHILFRKPKGSKLRGATGLQVAGVGKCDIRTDGNQIAITPTLYRWCLYDQIRVLPQGLAHQLEVATGAAGQSVKEVFKRFAEGEVFGEGERNTTLYRLAIGFLSLYRKLRGEDPEDEYWEALCEWLNEEAVEEPEENFAKYYHRYLRYNTDDFRLERFLTSERVRTGLRLMGLHLEVDRGSEETTEDGLQVFRGGDLVALSERMRWVVDGVIPEGSVVLVSAQPKVGKSTLFRQLAHCIASGTDFLNIPVNRVSRVIYHSNDEASGLIGRHLKRMSSLFDINQVEYWVGATTPVAFLKRLEKVRDAVVFVDVVGRWFEDINDYAKATQTMGLFRQLALTNNLTFILITHAPRTANRSLGSVALEGGADVLINLYREGSQRFMDIDGRCEKKAFGIPLRFDPETETYHLDYRSNLRMIEALSRLFGSADFVFADKLSKEDAEDLNRLISMGYAVMRVSQKGSTYFKLKVPYQTIQAELLRREEEINALKRRVQEVIANDGSEAEATENIGSGWEWDETPDLLDDVDDAVSTEPDALLQAEGVEGGRGRNHPSEPGTDEEEVDDEEAGAVDTPVLGQEFEADEQPTGGDVGDAGGGNPPRPEWEERVSYHQVEEEMMAEQAYRLLLDFFTPTLRERFKEHIPEPMEPNPDNFQRIGRFLWRFINRSQQRMGFSRLFLEEDPTRYIDLSLENPVERIALLLWCEYQERFYLRSQEKAANRSHFKKLSEAIDE